MINAHTVEGARDGTFLFVTPIGQMPGLPSPFGAATSCMAIATVIQAIGYALVFNWRRSMASEFYICKVNAGP
jgi:hypothetical protein